MREKRSFIFIFILSITISLSACHRYDVKDKVQLPKGAVGGISFQGDSIIPLSKNGTPLKRLPNENREGKIISKAVLTVEKINPCVIKFCPDNGVCEVYVMPELQSCPSWW